MSTVKELEEQLRIAKKNEVIQNSNNAELQKENEYNAYDLFWTEDKLKELIRNWYFQVQYIDDDYYILWIQREYVFWDDSWEDVFCKVKYGMDIEAYYDKYDEECDPIWKHEIDYVISKIEIIINNKIKDI